MFCYNLRVTYYLDKYRGMLALAFIFAGWLLFLAQLVPERGLLLSGSVLMLTGLCCLLALRWWHFYTLLLAGCGLMGIGFGVIFAASTGGASVLWGAGLGLLAVLFAGHTFFHATRLWPFYLAVPLFAVGFITITAQRAWMLTSQFVGVSLVLVLIGSYLGWQYIVQTQRAVQDVNSEVSAAGTAARRAGVGRRNSQ